MVRQQWIWHKNEFEHLIYKKMMLRRQERISKIIPSWLLEGAYDCMLFYKTGENKKDIWLNITAKGIIAVKIDNSPTYVENPYIPIFLPAGKHFIRIEVQNPNGLPCIYVEGEGYESNESWLTNYGNTKWQNAAGFNFNNKLFNPQDYKLPVRKLEALSQTKYENGTLYDFGREVLGFPIIRGINGSGKIELYYGESKLEALDIQETEVFDIIELNAIVDFVSSESRAFRYIYVLDAEDLEFDKIECNEEYYPLKNRGYFKCDDNLINQIYETSLYTLEMTSREFFIDGVKRDRWVWSGDCYQSALMSYYTHFDKDIIKRSIIALLGKGKIENYINTIMDYSFYLIITTHDYYLYTGDLNFISDNFERLEELLEFSLGRRNINGFMQKLDADDWVFVDWADIDNSGEVCVEQMLLYKSLKSMAEFAKILNKTSLTRYLTLAEELYEKLHIFWDSKNGSFAHDSSLNKLTRYGNIFSVLYDISKDKHGEIKKVFDKDENQKIYTPFMKLFELSAIAKLGGVSKILDYIKSYWSGMLEEGTCTFWEEYDPTITDEKKYAMYGRPYGKSLCHSWGASPLYLIGRYLVGLVPTEAGYKSFEIKPYLEDLSYEAVVPANDGSLYIKYDKKNLTIFPKNISGTLILDENQRINLEAGKKYKFKINSFALNNGGKQK